MPPREVKVDIASMVTMDSGLVQNLRIWSVPFNGHHGFRVGSSVCGINSYRDSVRTVYQTLFGQISEFKIKSFKLAKIYIK